MADHILVLDEGTTSTRAIVFDRKFEPTAMAQRPLPLAYPRSGWVEQDAQSIWAESLAAAREAVAAAGGAERIAALAIANQRETALLWDRQSGAPVGPAISWQDRRTAPLCERLRLAGCEAEIQRASGLLLDPYFSAGKWAWMFEHGGASRSRAEQGALAAGTVESWLIWNLTGGAAHVTDIANASRTSLMDLRAGAWSDRLAELFGVPLAMLPEITPCSGLLGVTDRSAFGRPIPILGAVGDQQGALFGQGCLAPGSAKITYGTGAFLLANTGAQAPVSHHRLLTTKAYGLGGGEAAFALEGSIFNAGTVVQWLRDDLGLIGHAADTEALARSVEGNDGVYFVPAFTGLGAPHWNAETRGEITGLSRGSRAAHVVRAGLEACAYQTRDLLEAFEADGAPVEVLRVDGGMAANDWLMQFIADVCDRPVERAAMAEMTALGAAGLAAIELGWTSPESWAGRPRAMRRFEPVMGEAERTRLLEGWRRAVAKAASA